MEKNKTLSFDTFKIADIYKEVPEDFGFADALKDLYKYIASYTLIDFGDGSRCAWCKRKVETIKNLDKHLINHINKDK